MGLTPELCFEARDRGWIGDNPFIHLDTTRMRELGWRPRVDIREAVEGTVDFLLDESWRLDVHR
jgi:UDP-glucose 4-epimerase